MTLVVRHHPESPASMIELESGRRNEGNPLVYGPVVSPDPEKSGLNLFVRVVAYLRRYDLAAKVELVRLDNRPVVRVRRLDPPVTYRLIRGDEPLEACLRFLKRRGTIKAATIRIRSGNWNLVTGRYGEKLLHEWLSHPAESGRKLPRGVELTRVVPQYYSSTSPRLVRGLIRAGVVSLPENWLLLRSVENGSFDEVSGRITVNVREAFAKRDHLVQSVHPFSFQVSLEEMNQCYAGALSLEPVTEGGFFCRKFGEDVFGRIESPPLLFRDLPLNVEDPHES